jgi:hypothetical protein
LWSAAGAAIATSDVVGVGIGVVEAVAEGIAVGRLLARAALVGSEARGGACAHPVITANVATVAATSTLDVRIRMALLPRGRHANRGARARFGG